MPPALSHIRRWEDYAPLQHDPATWTPHLTHIAHTHDLSGAVTLFTDGTHVTGAVNDAVIKLYLPFWRDGQTETAALDALQGGATLLGGVLTPRLIAQGRYQGWRYAVMERLPGVLLSELWPSMTPQERADVMGQVGRLLQRLHRAPVPTPDTSPGLDRDWAAFVARQRASAVERQRDWGLHEALCAALPAYLERALKPLHLGGLRLGWLHGDVTARQVLVSPARGFAVTGLIDFGDARLGHAEYDVAGAAAFMARGDAGALRALLLGYGYPSAALNGVLGARLLGWLLLHDHGDLRWLARTHLGGARLAEQWGAVQARLFPL